MAFKIEFHPDWARYYSQLDESIRKRIAKKVAQLIREQKFRHLKFGLEHCVVEVGQYRVCFIENTQEKKRIFVFVGDHKEYEKWIGLK